MAKEYPVEIELGRKESDAALSPAAPLGTKAKSRVFYPTLYIDAVPGLEQLPKEGCIMVKFRRKRLSLEEGNDGKETAGATLEIQKICLPDDMEGETLEEAFAKLGKGEVAADDAQYGYNDAEEDDEE